MLNFIYSSYSNFIIIFLFYIVLIFNRNFFELQVEYLVWAMFAKNREKLVQRDPSAAVKRLFNPERGLSILSLHILPIPAKP